MPTESVTETDVSGLGADVCSLGTDVSDLGTDMRGLVQM